MRRRPALHVLIALLLLIAQQFAFAHALSHQPDGTATEHACQLCASAGQLASGLPSAPPCIAFAAATAEHSVPPLLGCPARRHLAFHSRGPPASLR
jgi:hypothetical protein